MHDHQKNNLRSMKQKYISKIDALELSLEKADKTIEIQGKEISILKSEILDNNSKSNLIRSNFDTDLKYTLQ